MQQRMVCLMAVAQQVEVESITSFVEGNYINKDMIQDLSNLSIADVEKLGDLGFVFNISDGKVSGMVLSRRVRN